MKTLLTVLLIGLSVAFAQNAWAAVQPTPDEAKAMAIKAAHYLQTNGPAKAWIAFNAADGNFRDRNLYVFAQDNNCTMMANGANPALVGKNLCAYTDADGKPVAREISDVKGQAWIDYKMLNPLSKTVEAKTAFVVRVGAYVVGVGASKVTGPGPGQWIGIDDREDLGVPSPALAAALRVAFQSGNQRFRF